MNRFRLSFVLVAALLVAVPFVLSAGHDGKHEARHEVKIKIMQDGELLDLDLDGLEVGESRDFKSDSGKEVVVTRTDDGFDVSVDGKKLDIMKFHADGKGDGHRVIRIEKRMGDGDKAEGKEHKVIVLSGDEAGTIHADAEAFAFVQGDGGTLESVLKSGALDKLDPKTREEVIEALKKAFAEHEGGKKHVKVIVRTDEKDE